MISVQLQKKKGLQLTSLCFTSCLASNADFLRASPGVPDPRGPGTPGGALRTSAWEAT